MQLHAARRLAALALLAVSVSAACNEAEPKPPAALGALVDVALSSRVGVLLDEIPPAIRERVASALLDKPDAFWIARAKRQLALSAYRLNFRTYFYAQADEKFQLPLPPEALLEIKLVETDGTRPRRAQVDGHDYVLVDYTLATSLLTDIDSPAKSEPALAMPGGRWDEPLVLPVDPELLFQRTGYACMNEAAYPPNSVDSEDVEFFYDHECDVEPALSSTGCHLTELPGESCIAALTAHVGKVETAVHFERIAWNATRAKQVRVGSVSNPDGVDLEVLSEELRVNRLTYRYIEPDSCAIVEQCVGGPGWRRLLQFNASEKNAGAAPLNIGDVDFYLDEHPTPNANHHVYEFSACHRHYHFSHYATFSYAGREDLGSKRAFCIESVARYANNEHSPLWSPYSDCAFQGISAGWGDQYNAGIECQWVDVTAFDTSEGPITEPLGLRSNPDGFLCEGSPVLDAAGEVVWEATPFENAEGQTVDRPECNFMPGWDDNNDAEIDVTLPLPGEGMLTAACTRGQLGPHRNCGFAYDGRVATCKAGQRFSLRCALPDGSAPQVLRVCEASSVLGAGVACSDRDALASTDIESGAPVTIELRCPAARDAREPGGLYALYTAPSFTEDDAARVTCSVE